MTKLQAAANHVLEWLHDDHEDCYICFRPEGKGHDPEEACGELAVALKEELRGAKAKAKGKA